MDETTIQLCRICGGVVSDADGAHYEYPDGGVAHDTHERGLGAVLVITRVELHAVSIDTAGTTRYDPEFSIVRD